jgi:DnaJ-class molecular chaperone
MAENCYKLYKVCPTCKGTGSVSIPVGAGPTPTTVTCPECTGTKMILWGYCTEAIFSISDTPA